MKMKWKGAYERVNLGRRKDPSRRKRGGRQIYG
jgi:hypothetical protein